MTILKGDLITLALKGEFDVIVHGCNCFCTMGAGIAKGIKKNFPDAFKADKATEKGDKEKLGTISYAETSQGLIVVNAYTQFDWRGKGVKVDYDSVRECFREIKILFSGKRIGYPAIGAGLAGGDWTLIYDIIKEELEGEDHVYVKYVK